MLTEALDSSRYRYHRLFRDFLRSELRRTRPDRWNALHRSAAAFYERRGNEDRALHHWVEAGEIEEAWSRFRRRALPRFFDGAVTAVAQWTEMLPRPNVAIDVGQALDMALTLSYMGDIEGARDWSQLVDAGFVAGTDGNGDGGSAEGDTDTIARRAYLQFLLDFAQGDLVKAARQGKRARELLDRSEWSWDELRAPCAQAQLQSLMGRPARARATLLEFVARADPRHATDRVAVPGVFGEIALAEGRLAEAEAFSNDALDASRQGRRPGVLVHDHAPVCAWCRAPRTQPARRRPQRPRARVRARRQAGIRARRVVADARAGARAVHRRRGRRRG